MATKTYDSDAEFALGTEVNVQHSEGKLTLTPGQDQGSWTVDIDSELTGCGWGNFWWTGRTLLDTIFKNTVDVEFKNTSDVIWKSAL